MQLPILDDTIWFPDVNQALPDPDGLLALGGDLSAKRLICAYHKGIFPWYDEEQPILWWSPQTRAILSPEQVHISRSMQKWMKKTTFQVTVNYAFEQVVAYCADRQDSGTWITSEMSQAYLNLHHIGAAHSIEVWDKNQLVGGLYGVAVGQVFCGESMFHRATNASKLAFIRLATHFSAHHGALIDAQMPTHHLMSLGVKDCPRSSYIEQLERLSQRSVSAHCWEKQIL